MEHDADLVRLAQLLRAKNAADEAIAGLICRPCQIGHVGEWIAARIFDIDLHASAVAPGSDGHFRSGPLAGQAVNVKWYGLEESLLDVHTGAGPDTYLVMTGPRSRAASSRGALRPWVISSIYLFEHVPLVADLAGRGLKLGVAASVRRALWDAAEIYPNDRSPLMRVSPSQRAALELFAPPPVAGG